jgi:hypothetical protein
VEACGALPDISRIETGAKAWVSVASVVNAARSAQPIPSGLGAPPALGEQMRDQISRLFLPAHDKPQSVSLVAQLVSNATAVRLLARCTFFPRTKAV